MTRDVYIIWSADRARCLYVGFSIAVGKRLAAHEREWLREPYVVDRIVVPGGRRDAEAVERRKIQELQPEQNKAWKDGRANKHSRRTPGLCVADTVAEAGYAAPQLLARAALLLVVTLVAVVVGWNAPAGTPLAALLTAVAGYTIARLLMAGALATGRHQRAGGGR